MSLDVKLDFVSGGINPRSNCLAVSENTNVIVYASANVMIVGYVDKKIPSYKHILSLRCHESNIGCLKLIEKNLESFIIVSGDINGSLAVTVMHIKKKDYEEAYHVSVTDELTGLKPYEMPINWIACYELISLDTGEYLIAVGSCESHILVYKLYVKREGTSTTLEPFSKIGCKNQLPLAGEFVGFEGSSNPLMLVGNDRGELTLFSITVGNYNGNSKDEQVLAKIKNHSDWLKAIRVIKTPQFIPTNSQGLNCIYIATAGQDGLIIIYKLCDFPVKNFSNVGTFKWGTSEGGQSRLWFIYKESVLCGHGESRITDIQWTMYEYTKGLKSNQIAEPTTPDSAFKAGRATKQNDLNSLKLISTSEDRNIVKWSLDGEHTDENIWSDKIRFGMLNVHNNTGFLGCIPFKSSILSYGFDGAIYLWKSSCNRNHSYKLYYFVSGHTRSVESVDWQPELGNFLVSSSKDSTCRVFAKHHYLKYGYCEMARPQTHGFGINCARMLFNGYMASAAEEKMIRIFITPLTFYKTYSKYIGGKKYKSSIPYENIPIGAVLRPLGLSNKAVFDDDLMRENSSVQFNNSSLKEYGQMPIFQTIDLAIEDRLLNEEKLQQSTLWPEHDKLYGHGNEVLVIEVNHKLKLLASACIANNKETAEIILWNMDDWSIKQKIKQHKLTVTALKFSPDGLKLLSVSRDRTWALFYYIQSDDSVGRYELTMDSNQTNFPRPKHSRIIWDCTWSFDSEYFATGSRDSTVIVWNRTTSGTETFGFKLPHPVTALSFNNHTIKQSPPYMLVVGTEIGQLFLYNKTLNFEWCLVYTISNIYSPGKCINEISFKPINENSDNSNSVFAVASSDHSVRVYSII